jgi:tetratricopeptide (TPR) repeat protein
MKSDAGMKFSILSALFFIFIFAYQASALDNIPISFSGPVAKIISSENDPSTREILIETAKTLTAIYGNLYENCVQGKKIKIFMDPAHGMVFYHGSMQWQAALTWRKSTTGEPEEVYSIPLARGLYRIMSANPHFEIISSPNYLEMLQGKIDTYNDMTFDESVAGARTAHAFMIVSEHLNNIAPISKADGFVNIRGLHITCDWERNPHLSYISSIYRGYFTYYSIFDTTGMSRRIGEGFRDNMIAGGFTPNAWGNGIVGDDRFSTYINYPISIIYESAFISNPAEEALLRDKKHQDLIVQSQYSGIIEAIKNTFGVDLSSDNPIKVFDQDPSLLDSIILNRFALYYTQNMKYAKAIETIRALEQLSSPAISRDNIAAYSGLKNKIYRVMQYDKTAKWYTANGKFIKAMKSYRAAIKIMGRHPLFNGARESTHDFYNYCAERIGARKIFYDNTIKRCDVFPPDMASFRTGIESHSLRTPYIVTITEGQELNEAIDLSIAPGDEIRNRIQNNVRNGYITKSVYMKSYSKIKKRYIYKRAQTRTRADFSPGLYIVRFNKNLSLRSVEKVSNVIFDPNRYQNQQFFKNSCLAEKTKEKSL